jgi:hypothetical protein
VVCGNVGLKHACWLCFGVVGAVGEVSRRKQVIAVGYGGNIRAEG